MVEVYTNGFSLVPILFWQVNPIKYIGVQLKINYHAIILVYMILKGKAGCVGALVSIISSLVFFWLSFLFYQESFNIWQTKQQQINPLL